MAVDVAQRGIDIGAIRAVFHRRLWFPCSFRFWSGLYFGSWRRSFGLRFLGVGAVGSGAATAASSASAGSCVSGGDASTAASGSTISGI